MHAENSLYILYELVHSIYTYDMIYIYIMDTTTLASTTLASSRV